MQSGEFIVNRWIVEAIETLCREQAISIKKYSSDWILELEKNHRIERILGYKFPLNSSTAAAIAQDKVAAYEIMTHHSIPAVPHKLLRTKVGTQEVKEQWNAVVLKPLTGTSGHLVNEFKSMSAAIASMKQSRVEAWAVSPRLDITK